MYVGSTIQIGECLPGIIRTPAFSGYGHRFSAWEQQAITRVNINGSDAVVIEISYVTEENGQ
jgi:hypothetical protein